MNNFLIRLFLITEIGGFLLWKFNPQLLFQLSQVVSKASTEFIISSVTPNVEEAKVETQSIAIEEIRQLSELTTSQLNLQLVIPTEQSANFGGFEIGKTKVLYIAKTKIEAGIDLNKINQSNIQFNSKNRETTLTLPSPEVLDIKLDTNQSKLYDASKTTFLAPDTAPQLVVKAQEKAIEDSKKEVCNSKLLEEANISAKSKLELFFKLSNAKVLIKTMKPTACEKPNS